MNASTATPLAGKRIVITRAADQSYEFADKLTALGAQPLLVPTIAIAPFADLSRLQAALKTLSTYDWLIFTSVNGVEIFWERLMAQPGMLTLPPSLQIAAVGPATAAALHERGCRAAFTPSDYVAEAIAAGLGNVTGKRILLPQAELARTLLADVLTAQGALMTAIPIYQTLPADLAEPALAELRRGVDVITFTSGSTVRNFAAALEKAGEKRLVAKLVQQSCAACIGPVTAQAAQSLGWAAPLIAKEHTTDGLLTALLEHFQKESL